MLKLVTLTCDLHQMSPHGKDALVYQDHFPVEFLKISQLEAKILAFLVSGRGTLPKTLHPYRTHPLPNFELNFLLVNVIDIGNNSTKFHENLTIFITVLYWRKSNEKFIVCYDFYC
jgi:hypothetical protein